MLKKVMGAAVMATFAACSPTYAPTPLRSLIVGLDVAEEVELEGRLDTGGINFTSLYPTDADPAGSDCVALIVSQSDRRRTKEGTGKLVRVRGRPIASADLKKILPDDWGEIERRPWSGTKCDGEYVVFVKRLDFLR